MKLSKVEYHPIYNPRPTKLQQAISYRMRRLCQTEGHKIRDCSSAGPDSGDMDHECVRCGRYWSVPLY